MDVMMPALLLSTFLVWPLSLGWCDFHGGAVFFFLLSLGLSPTTFPLNTSSLLFVFFYTMELGLN
jgi:hypothetical protein